MAQKESSKTTKKKFKIDELQYNLPVPILLFLLSETPLNNHYVLLIFSHWVKLKAPLEREQHNQILRNHNPLHSASKAEPIMSANDLRVPDSGFFAHGEGDSTSNMLLGLLRHVQIVHTTCFACELQRP